MSENSVITANVEKKYSLEFCLKVKNFHNKRGETTALLGKNGSGKSTFINILTGNIEPDSGDVFYCEQKMTLSSYKLKQKIGYLPQHCNLPPWSTGYDLLNYIGNLHEINNLSEQIKEVSAYWRCENFLTKPLATCSSGMKKTIALALVTLNNPTYLILDEPFSSLDVIHIDILEQYLKKRRENNLTTILSTHLLLYAVELSQNIYVLNNGLLKRFERNKDNDRKELHSLKKLLF